MSIKFHQNALFALERNACEEGQKNCSVNEFCHTTKDTARGFNCSCVEGFARDDKDVCSRAGEEAQCLC